MGAQLTTLIPAYKPDYLAALFAGLRSQVFRDFRVIVSDDSPDATITSMLRAGRFDPFIEGLDMLVVRGPQSPLRNHQHLLDVWAHATPLVHLLMDDDVVYPRFYLEHVALHARHSPAASVSLRWLTSSDGAPMATLPLPEFVEAGDRHSLAVGAGGCSRARLRAARTGSANYRTWCCRPRRRMGFRGRRPTACRTSGCPTSARC